MSTSVYAKPTQCRLNQAYATAYATYAVCMEAYARGTTCLVEFPLYLLFCIQKKNATQMSKKAMALFTKWTKNLRFMAIQTSYFYIFLPPWDGRNSHDPNIRDGPRNSEDREPVSVASWTPCSRCFSYGRPKRQANLIERNIQFFAFVHHFTSILHPFYIHFTSILHPSTSTFLDSVIVPPEYLPIFPLLFPDVNILDLDSPARAKPRITCLGF